MLGPRPHVEEVARARRTAACLDAAAVDGAAQVGRGVAADGTVPVAVGGDHVGGGRGRGREGGGGGGGGGGARAVGGRGGGGQQGWTGRGRRRVGHGSSAGTWKEEKGKRVM